MEKVAIVNVNSFGREFPEFLEELKEKVGDVKKFMFPSSISGEELAKALEGYHYVILGNDPTFDKEFFKHNHDVKLIARHGLGFNNVDLEAAKEKGVYVTKEENIIEQDAVAEQAVALLNTVAKNVVKANAKVHNNAWRKDRQELMGFQLRDMTTGIIGYGNIGFRFGEIMQYGYNNRILAYDPYLSNEKADELGVVKCDLDTLFKESDFISLHANLTDDSKHIVNADSFSKMKSTAILINAARGALVDETALINALKEKQIFGYGADVAMHEPIEEDNELLTFDNVVITPHVAVYNLTCTKNMNRKVMEDIYLVQEGKKPKGIVNGL